METVRILDSYRFAVARDADAVRLLALLHRVGPLTEEEVVAQSELPQGSVRDKLTELFRANLILLIDPARYATSELAEMILANLGVHELATLDLLRRARLSDSDREFLTSCISAREQEPIEWRRYLATAARAVARLEQWRAVVPETTRRMWFAAVVGLDPLSHELGPDNYAERITGTFGSGKSSLHLSRLRDTCREAIDDRAVSNEFLLNGVDRRGDDHLATTLALTFVRLAASTASRQIDDGLAAATAFQGIHRDALRRLVEWSKPIERECVSFWHEVSHRRMDAEPTRLVYFFVDQLPYCDVYSRTAATLGVGPWRSRMERTPKEMINILGELAETLERRDLTVAQAAAISAAAERVKKHAQASGKQPGMKARTQRKPSRNK
jgi:hypothetical protein